MMKRFVKNYRENILLCISALCAGIISFFVTLYFYPNPRKIVENEKITQPNNLNISAVNIISGEEDISIIPVFENIDENTKECVVENEPVLFETKEIIPEATTQENFTIKQELDFEWPLSGDIIKNFANDFLIYSSTLNEWTTHEGIDIAGNEGDVIVSVEDGIVEQIYEDEKYGKTIIVSHEKGYKSRYSFVSPENLVIEKQRVRKGEAIGRLTISTNFESKDREHLHFEIIKDDENLSPITEILKK